MSLSESQRELLLSASLDDALNPEEQALLDQWFGEDPTAQRQRDELAAIRDQLRVAFASTRAAKLDSGFAQRVVEAAIEQARRENLAPTHPLVRLALQAEREDSAQTLGKPLRWRWVAASLVLAASIVLAIFVAPPAGDADVEAPQRVADANAGGQAIDAGQESIAAIGGGSDSADSTPAPLEIAATDAADASVVDSLAVDPSGRPAVEQITAADAIASDAQLPMDIARVQPQGTPDELAAGGEIAAGGSTTLPGEGVVRPQTDAMPLAFVLVVSVEMTPQGRESLALLEALRHADIQIGPAGVVTQEVVTHLRQTDVIQTPDDDASAKLYFIEAPAKQLDRFLLRLMAEKDAVASFGFSIADNPPLLASVSDWREIDPAKLRHTNLGAIARDLVSSDGTPLAIDRGRAFIPVPSEMDMTDLLAAPAAADSDADDIPSQILLLIR